MLKLKLTVSYCRSETSVGCFGRARIVVVVVDDVGDVGVVVLVEAELESESEFALPGFLTEEAAVGLLTFVYTAGRA